MSDAARLQFLMEGIPARHLAGPPDAPVRAITADSRKVALGTCFVAIRGTAQDGHRFLADALQRGASAIVVEEGQPLALPAAPAASIHAVPDPRRTLGELSRALHGRPDVALSVVAITGTNGKTTTSHVVRDMLNACGRPCGLLGTIAYDTGARRESAKLTTPDAAELFALLAEMRDNRLTACAMEASSHALDQQRLGSLEVDVAAFSNLTREHLDYHPTLEAYLAAKRKLLEHLEGPTRRKRSGRAVVNVEDPVLGAAVWPRDTVTVGHRPGAVVRLVSSTLRRDGTELSLEVDGRSFAARANLLGGYNVENLLLAVGVGHALGLSAAELQLGLRAARTVSGRMEPVELPGGPLVLVDYAHTPDGMSQALAAARLLAQRQGSVAGRLLLVFGCGGDRDRGKRPLMAEVAAAGADLSILTLDNPRTEDPRRIFADAQRGFANADAGDRARTVEDRARAIEEALREARPQDVVLIAGKGHENYQILGTEKQPWDDRDAARQAWSRLQGASRTGRGTEAA